MVCTYTVWFCFFVSSCLLRAFAEFMLWYLLITSHLDSQMALVYVFTYGFCRQFLPGMNARE